MKKDADICIVAANFESGSSKECNGDGRKNVWARCKVSIKNTRFKFRIGNRARGRL